MDRGLPQTSYLGAKAKVAKRTLELTFDWHNDCVGSGCPIWHLTFNPAPVCFVARLRGRPLFCNSKMIIFFPTGYIFLLLVLFLIDDCPLNTLRIYTEADNDRLGATLSAFVSLAPLLIRLYCESIRWATFEGELATLYLKARLSNFYVSSLRRGHSPFPSLGEIFNQFLSRKT